MSVPFYSTPPTSQAASPARAVPRCLAPEMHAASRASADWSTEPSNTQQLPPATPLPVKNLPPAHQEVAYGKFQSAGPHPVPPAEHPAGSHSLPSGSGLGVGHGHSGALPWGLCLGPGGCTTLYILYSLEFSSLITSIPSYS